MAFDLAKAVRDAAPNASVAVPAGTYEATLVIEKPLSLVAMGRVVLDAGGRASVARIATKDGVVRLAGFIIAGGDSPEGGGGVAVLAGAVELLECTFRYNKAPVNGGGGLWATGASQVTVTRCRFEGNTGRQGGAILVDEVAGLKLSDSTVIQNAAVLGGGLKVREGATAAIHGCTIADNKVVGDAAMGSALHLSGSTTRAPAVSLSHCIVSERAEGPACLFNGSPHPGKLTLTRNLLPPWCKALGGDNVFAEAKFTLQGTEPYQLLPDSPAVGAAADDGFPKGAKDLSGRARHSSSAKPALGAFSLVR